MELLLKHSDTTLRDPETGASALHAICYGSNPLAPDYLKRLIEVGLVKEVVCEDSGTVLC